MQTSKDNIISAKNQFEIELKQFKAKDIKDINLKNRFYKVRMLLEQYFNMFLNYKGDDFETYYNQHENDYNKALDNYKQVVIEIKKKTDINKPIKYIFKIKITTLLWCMFILVLVYNTKITINYK